MFKISAVLVLTACGLYAEQSLVLNGTNLGIGTFPTTGVFAAPLTQYRIEFRFDGLALPQVSGNNNFCAGGCWTGVSSYWSSDSNSILYLGDSSTARVSIGLNGATSGIVRYQVLSSGTYEVEYWNLAGVKVVVPVTASGPIPALNLSGQPVSFGSSLSAVNIAWARFSTTTVPLGSPPPSLTYSGSSGVIGNLGDWEFEGNGVDQSSNGTTITGVGITSSTCSGCTTTSVVPINVVLGAWGQQRVFSANRGALALDGSASYSPIMNFYNLAGYAFSQISGPSTGAFTGSGAHQSYTANTRGDYVLQLTVTDGVDSPVSAQQDFGAVLTNALGIVQTGNASMDTSIGPLTMFGAATTPWPWYDFTEMGDADSLYTLLTTPPTYGTTALAGTIAVTNGGNTFTGTSTNFLADIIDCNSSGSSSAQTCTAPSVSSLINFSARDRYWIPGTTTGSTVTLNVNGYGAFPVSGGPFTAGQIYALVYTSSAYSSSVGQPLIYVWIPTPAPSYALYNVVSIASNTSMVIASGVGYSGPTTTGLQYSHPDTGEQFVYWNYAGQPSNNLDYYDVVHALYKLYYRTGLTKYQTEARTFADLWFKYSIGAGYRFVAPRAMGFIGIADRALDGKPEYWTSLNTWLTESIVTYYWLLPPFSFTSPQAVGYGWDTREIGYSTRYVLRQAQSAANPDGTPNATWRAQACTWLHNVVANVMVSTQDSIGQWESDGYSGNPSVPLARLPSTRAFGSAPWRDAMSGIALQEAYPVLLSSCSDPTTAAASLTTATKFASLLNLQGGGYNSALAGWGQWGDINYGSNQLNYTHFPNGQSCAGSGGVGCIAPYTTGTLAVTNGSTAVVGTGTNFTGIFPAIFAHTTPVAGIDSSFIAIPQATSSTNSGSPAPCNSVVQVASITDDTHLTLTDPWPCTTGSNIGTGGGGSNPYGWIGTPAALTNCASYQSSALTCESPTQVSLQPDPTLSPEVPAVLGWMYDKTGTISYLNGVQRFGSSEFGGSGGGPGSTLPPSGPLATGLTGAFAAPLVPCGQAPCGGSGPGQALGKYFGFSAGAGNANNAWAYSIPKSSSQVYNSSMSGKVITSGKIGVQ